MANTLYDILELSPQASAETITANFKRLHAAHGSLAASGDQDATNRMVALKEAYLTLSDPVRRQKYDEGLTVRMSMVDASPSGSRGSLKWVMLVIALGLSSFAVQNHFANQKLLAEQERTRLLAEQTAAALRLAEIEAQREQDERVAAQQEERRRRQAEAIERFERERAMDYGKQVSRDLERAEERERQQRTQAERQRQYDAERQLAREKTYLRQLEAENRRRTYY